MYKLEPLKYSFEDLEPYIDTHTLALHHLKHQKNYLDKLNSLLAKNNYDYKYRIEELYRHINEFSKKDIENILFNLGGVLNHNLYFRSMAPDNNKPNDWLGEHLIKDFGSYENFEKYFKEAALSIRGSGYVFLVLQPNGRLAIITLMNQESPYFYNLLPLIALDMWEHAYYINYENKKDLYIDNFLDIIDFKCANSMINEFRNIKNPF